MNENNSAGTSAKAKLWNLWFCFQELINAPDNISKSQVVLDFCRSRANDVHRYGEWVILIFTLLFLGPSALSFVCSPTHCFVLLFHRPQVPSFQHSFVPSFLRSFVPSLLPFVPSSFVCFLTHSSFRTNIWRDNILLTGKQNSYKNRKPCGKVKNT